MRAPSGTVTSSGEGIAQERTSGARVLAAASLGVFAGFGSLFIFTFGVFLKPVSNEFGWTRAQISSGFLGAVLAVAICSPFLGRIFDRYPARRIIIPCTVAYSLLFASLAFLTPHLSHYVAVLILMGAVGNGTTQLGYARVISAWFDRARGRALAVVMAGSGVGSAVLPPMAQYFIASFGWRRAYVLLAGIALLTALPMTFAFLYEPLESPHQESPQSIDLGRGIRRDLVSLPFLGIVGALLLFSLATNGLNTHWVALLTDRGFPAARAATVVSIAGFAALGSKLTTGYLLDRFRAPFAVAALCLLCATGIALTALAKSNDVAIVAAALVGAGMGAESDAVPYLLTRYFGLQRFSELYGYTWTVYAVAGGVGPILAGAAFDSTHSYRSALILFSGMVVAAAGLFALLPRYGARIEKS